MIVQNSIPVTNSGYFLKDQEFISLQYEQWRYLPRLRTIEYGDLVTIPCGGEKGLLLR